MKKSLSAAVGGLLIMAMAGTAMAQESPGSGTDLVREVAALRKSVEELVSLLDGAVHHQRVELLLKRLELKQRRVSPLEGELRGARQQLNDLENERRHMEGMLEESQAAVTEDIRSGTDRPDSENRAMVEQGETALKFIDGEIESEERRIRDLEDEIVDGREAIETLENTIEELFATLLP